MFSRVDPSVSSMRVNAKRFPYGSRRGRPFKLVAIPLIVSSPSHALAGGIIARVESRSRAPRAGLSILRPW